MNILKDMELFVRIVHCDGLAAAGREMGITPSSVTMRIKNLEEHYNVKLLTRTTRSINLTGAGHEFYQDSLRMLDDINGVENRLKASQETISGQLRITATSDFGRQHIVPLLNDFVGKYPDVTPFLNLSDSLTDLTENNIDIAIRYGTPPDTQLITHKIADSHRVLCASPAYLERFGTPKSYTDLKDHSCLTMVQFRTPMSKWYFDTPQGEKSMVIQPVRSCDDGALVRQWAIDGAGIALKSYWDIANDLADNRLVSVLDEYRPDFRSHKMAVGSDLLIAYQDRKYVPLRTREFIKHTVKYFDQYQNKLKLHQQQRTSKSGATILEEPAVYPS